MADTVTKTATPRTRTRAAAKATTPAATKTAAAATPKAEEGRQKLTFSLMNSGDTKNYTTFDLSKDVDGNATGCVGKFYAPLGTEEVKVLVVGSTMEIE